MPITDVDLEQTAFATKHGLYQFVKTGFGLCIAHATYARVLKIGILARTHNYQACGTMSVLHQLLPVIYQRPCKIDCADLPNPGKKTFLWNQEKEDAFQELKEALALSHVLVIPNKDDMFVLDTGTYTNRPGESGHICQFCTRPSAATLIYNTKRTPSCRGAYASILSLSKHTHCIPVCILLKYQSA